MTCGMNEILGKQDGSFPPKVRTLTIHVEKIFKISNISRRKDSMDMRLYRELQHNEIHIMNKMKYKGLNIQRNNKLK